MSPEALVADSHYNEKIDVFSLGVLINRLYPIYLELAGYQRLTAAIEYAEIWQQPIESLKTALSLPT